MREIKKEGQEGAGKAYKAGKETTVPFWWKRLVTRKKKRK